MQLGSMLGSMSAVPHSKNLCQAASPFEHTVRLYTQQETVSGSSCSFSIEGDPTGKPNVFHPCPKFKSKGRKAESFLLFSSLFFSTEGHLRSARQPACTNFAR